MGSTPWSAGGQGTVVGIGRPNDLHTEDQAEAERFPFLSSPLWKKKCRNCNIFWNPILSTCIRHPQHKKHVRHLSRKPDDWDPKLISWHIPILCEMLMFKYSKIWDICEFSKYPLKATRFCWGCMGILWLSWGQDWRLLNIILRSTSGYLRCNNISQLRLLH